MNARDELAVKKLEVIRRLLWKYEYLLDPAEVAADKKLCDSMSAALTLEQYINVDLAMAFYQRITRLVTIARVDEIRLKVEKQSAYWVNKYGEQFTKTESDRKAQQWLFGAKSGEYKLVKEWIENGWNLLRRELSAPWGHCKLCEGVLRPKQVGGEKKVWMIFEKCDSCYMAEKSADNERLEATRGHKVAKPGSAAKHGHGHAVNPNVRPMDRKKGKK